MILADIGNIDLQDARTWLWAATLVYAIGFGMGGYFAKKGKIIPGMGFLGFVLLGLVACQSKTLEEASDLQYFPSDYSLVIKADSETLDRFFKSEMTNNYPSFSFEEVKN